MIWLGTIFRLAIGTRIGRVISLCIVAYVAMVGYRWKIKADMRAEQAVAQIRLELATAKADLDATKAAAERAGVLSARLMEIERKNQELANEAARLAKSCLLSPADADRLRRLK